MVAGSITQPNWVPTVPDDADEKQAKKIVISSQPAGLWTRVADFVPSGRKLKIQAAGTGTWVYDASKVGCTADGAAGDASGCMVPQAMIGCLVGKVGGSASDSLAQPQNPAAGSTIVLTTVFVFAAGSFCVVQVPPTVAGPLFLTMNDAPGNFSKHSGTIEIQVYDAS
jgi:hypothetical protein